MTEVRNYFINYFLKFKSCVTNKRGLSCFDRVSCWEINWGCFIGVAPHSVASDLTFCATARLYGCALGHAGWGAERGAPRDVTATVAMSSESDRDACSLACSTYLLRWWPSRARNVCSLRTKVRDLCVSTSSNRTNSRVPLTCCLDCVFTESWSCISKILFTEVHLQSRQWITIRFGFNVA